MSALFERAQKTVVMITSVPVTAAELDTATWLNLSCTIKQAERRRTSSTAIFMKKKCRKLILTGW
ncbi:Uncharacterised protein [Klebsiella pneumoniae]|nr:Uncharacterised protein [Klebsiella pneumoniae]